MSSIKMSKATCAASSRQAVFVKSPALASSVTRSSSKACTRAAFSSTAAAAPARLVITKAAATAEKTASPIATKTEWFALVANQEFFFNDIQNESIAEQLRERVRFYKEQNKEHDFFLVPDPVWLDAKFPSEAKQVKRPCVALVTTDKMWAVFMKVRLDRVLRIDLGEMPQAEVLKAGGKVRDFKAPEKWTAPYAPYSKGWWEPFLPK